MSNTVPSTNLAFMNYSETHLERGGFVSPISGAPMCACLEQMPVVTRADCTQIDVDSLDVEVEINKGKVEVKIPESENKIKFSPCLAEDGKTEIGLREHYELMVDNTRVVDKRREVAKRLVGEGQCLNNVLSFLRQKGV